MSRVRRPHRDEYADYYHRYVHLVPDGDITELLGTQRAALGDFFGALRDADGARRYAPEKWSIKQIVGHLVDVERVFASRAHAFSRGETSALPGFDENAYVAATVHDARRLRSLVQELDTQRRASLAFFAGLTEEEWSRTGVANGDPMSVRAAAYVLHGHATHHIAVVKDRYLHV